MKKNILYLLLMGIIIAIGCQKETSFELPNTPAIGSLQDDASGDCLPKTVNGTYAVGQALVPTTHSITVSVDVVKTGTYTIYTDTVNGYYFRATGSFTTLGTNTVTLRGNGTPFAPGTNNFVVNFSGTVCDIQVTVTSPAVFTLAGAPNACTTPVINGTYGKDVPLTAANTVVLQVNVTQVGAYNVTTTAVNGMTFSGSGVFPGTGAQTITLTGTGTPNTVGNNTIPVTVGSSTCSFVINVIGPGVATLGGAPNACTPSTVNGTYAQNVALTSSNTVTVQVNVTTAGVISISTNTVAGFSFSFTGPLNTGVQNVNLVGTGTPNAAGTQNFTVTLGSSTCTFSVPVTGPGVGTLGGAPAACTPSTVNGTYTQNVALTAANTVTIQVNVTTPGTFNITTNTVTGFSFAFSGPLLTTGVQNVNLVGTGTPTATGPQNFTVTLGSSTCTFTVTVAGSTAAVFTIDCPNVVVNGTYTAGTPLTAANTITLPVTVTTAGTYNISASVNGMTFSATGSATLATTTITLTGTGTPTTATGSPFTLVVNGCNIPITVTAPPTIDWSFKIGSTTYSGSTSDVIGLDNTSFPPFTLVDYYGEYLGNLDKFNLTLGDPSGGVFTAGETYNTNFTTVVNGAYFYFDGLPGLELEATDPGTTPGVNIIVTITSHNTATKTIIATFSGTAFDYVSSTVKTITNGTVKIVYPN